MKYTYAYKTSDGVRHEDSLDARSRDEAFAVLRGRGIRPIKVVAADGSKENGEWGIGNGERGRRSGWVVGAVAVLFVAFALFAFFVSKWGNGERGMVNGERGVAANASPRHQIYGDPAVVSAFERGDFADALPRDGDRLLAMFAQPGKLMCARGVDTRRMPAEDMAAFARYAEAELAVERDVAIDPADSREVAELKQIVNGMRGEMREYLANGNGTPRSYWRRLNERTAQEIHIYDRTRRELEKESSEDVWERKNDALRRLGLRTIPNPNEG